MKKYLEKAIAYDKNDDLADFKKKFVIEDENLIYLDGNSLGRLPVKSKEVIKQLVDEQWGRNLIRSWNKHWMELSSKLAGKIAKIIGARKDEVFVGDTTSLNLYKLMFAALSMDESKTKVLSDSLNFPTDIYVIQGLINQHFKNHQLHLLESKDGLGIDEDQIIENLDSTVGAVSFSHVAFKSSFMYNMQRVNQLVHKNNSLMIWDLSHAAGAVPIDLNGSNADMAVGCTYKYLNGGPGAPAFLYIRKDLQDKMQNPVWAWFSHAKPFDFSLEYQPSCSIQQMATGTPSILSLAAIEPGLDITLEAGMDRIRKKSLMQSKFMIEMIQEFLVPLGFKFSSPLNDNIRGSHISIQHPEAYRISQAMIEPNDGSKIMIPDFRPPNNIRLGIAPLYNSFLDIYETVELLYKIVKEGQFKEYSSEKKLVT